MLPVSEKMPQINPKLEYDAFICYAHLDDQAGWVTSFHEHLSFMIQRFLGREPKIWRDNQIVDQENFTSEIYAALDKALIIIIVLSPRFLKRPWFAKEYSRFIEAANRSQGIVIGNKSRIINVMIGAIPRDEMPDHLAEILGYTFFEVNPEIEMPEQFSVGTSPYFEKIHALAHDICELITVLERDAPERSKRAG